MISLLLEYLSIYYQTGDTAQLAMIARSLLTVIPDDLVALQFLGMALYQMGYLEDAYRAFQKVATRQEHDEVANCSSVCESASAVSYREAVGVHSGLADGWRQIARIARRFGFKESADRADTAAAACSQSR